VSGQSLLIFAATVALFCVSVTVLRLANRRRVQSSLQAFELSFPRGLKVEEVEAFLDGLTGMLLPWFRRWLTNPYVVLEAEADEKSIRHYLLVPAAWERSVLGLLSANLPGVRFSACTAPSVDVAIGSEYRLTTNGREVGGEAAAASSRLLASLHPLGRQEAVVVQWVVTPHAPVAPVRVAPPNGRNWLGAPDGVMPNSEEASALKTKRSKPLLLGVGRIAVGAESRDRARSLLRHTEVAWHSVRAPGVHLERRWIGEHSAAKRVRDRQAPLIEWPGVYNTSELARLIGFPIEAVAVPGLMLGGCRPLAPSPAIPRFGTVIGDSNFPGSQRPLALGLQGRLRHVHLLGPTGYGKSTLMVNMIVQDLEAGYGCVVLDPKGDLVQSVLERIPEKRLGDVVVLDPADTERPVGLNPLQSIDRDHQEVVVENLVGLFKSLYRNSWGPRLDDILRAALLTLAGAKGSTLCEVPLILTDPAYRRRLVGRLDDPIGLESFWGWYEALSDAERAMAVGPVLNKVRAFTMRPRVRSIIGQSQPALNLRDVLASNKILLVSLATGLLGEEAAALLGALVVAELWHATMARASQHSDSRKPTMAFLDEWQHFVHLPIPMSSVLAEARGLGLGLTLAHQHISQLPEETRGAVLADTRSRVVFQLPAADARLMAREMGGVLTPEDLMGLGQYEIAAQLFAGGSTQIPVTATTRAMGPQTSDPIRVRDNSRSRFGVPRIEVEVAIRKRQQSGPPKAIGRHDRRSERNGGGK